MYKIRDWLYITNYRNSTNTDLLNTHKIGALLQLAAPVTHPGIKTLYVAVEDGEPVAHDKLAQGITFIREQKAEGHKVVSACGAGISRSTTFALAVLMAEENLTWLDAYASILQQHADAMPHAKLMQSLLEYLGEPVPSYVDLWHQIVSFKQT